MMVSAYIAHNSSLVIEPSRVLKFPLISSDKVLINNTSSFCSGGPDTKSLRAFLTLRNLSRRKLSLFKIRTTRPEVYSVQPIQGFILPASSIKVVVTFVTLTTEKLMQMSTFTRQQLHGQFLIQSYDRCEDESKSLDMECFSEYWQRIPKELVINKRLKCEFAVLPGGFTESFSDNYLEQQQLQNKDSIVTVSTKSSSSQTREKQQPEFAVSPLKHLAASFKSSLEVKRERSRCIINNNSSNSSYRNENVCSLQEKGKEQEEEKEEEQKQEKPSFCVQPNENHVEFVYATRQKTCLVSNFSLMNCSSNHAWIFKIKTTNVYGYSVKPSKGLVCSLGCQNIEVETNLLREEDKKKLLDFEKRETQDKFLIEIILIDHKTYKELKFFSLEKQKEQVTQLWNQIKKKKPKNRYITTQMLHCKFIQEASIQVRHILPLKEIHLPEQKKLDQESLVFKKKKKQEEEEYSANELDDSEVGSEDEFDDNDNDDDPSVFFENNSSLSKLGRTENGNSLLDSQQEYILSLEDDTQRIARDTRKYFLI